MKNTQRFNLKEKIVNSFMQRGRKETSEKILNRTIKKIQKLNKKNSKSQLQIAVINLTPVFKLNKQSKKRGKKKQINYVPNFLFSNYLRISFALKQLKRIIMKNKQGKTFEDLAKEILTSSNSGKSISMEQKNDLQKQVLSQKRYFYKFRW